MEGYERRLSKEAILEKYIKVPAVLFFFFLCQSAQAQNNTQPVSLFDDTKTFLEVYAGYDFALLGDISGGSNAWVQAGKSDGYPSSGGGNNSGIQGGALIGLHLDPKDSLALDLGGVLTFNNNWSINYGGGIDSQTLSSDLLEASLDYTLEVVQTADSRIYLTLGAGYYHAIVNDTLLLPGSGINSNGVFTGDTFGGTLGVGEEWKLGNSLGLDISLKGRWANFGKVSASSANAVDGTGPSSLAMVTSTFASGATYTVLMPYTNAGLSTGNPNLRYATVDYSGIDANVALAIHF